MKVLNFEDSVYKANAIRKILGNRCSVASVEQVSNVEDGLKMLKDAENAYFTHKSGKKPTLYRR